MFWVVLEVNISMLLGWSAILGFYDFSALEYEGRTFRRNVDNQPLNQHHSIAGCNIFFKVSEGWGRLFFYKMKDKWGTVRQKVGGNVSEG